MSIWARKTYRIIVGSMFPAVYYFTPKWVVISIIGFFLLLVSILEVERHIHPGLWPFIIKRPYGKIFKKEPGKILGTTYFLLGSLLTIIFFEKSIAITVLLFTVFGDAISAIIGVRYGKIKLFGNKTLEGSLSFFLICIALGLGLIYLPRLRILHTLNLFLILFGSAAAAFMELLPLRVDDNLSVLIFSGIVMEIVRRV